MKARYIAILLCVLLAPWMAVAFETGDNDFRVSDMGPEGDATFRAVDPAVAYNPVDHEYLVVWSGDDDRDPQVEDEFEIFRQRIDAATGQGVGANDRRISAMGGLGDAADDAKTPAVAYNPDAHEYLVVWSGRLDGDPVGIFGQRLDAATGQPRGADDFLISDGSRAFSPKVAYNPTQREYLVVWSSEGVAPLVQFETEIFIRRVAGATGVPRGPTHQRISEMFGLGNSHGSARSPAVAVDPIQNRYLVVWSGRDTAGFKAEVYGQLIDGATGLEVGLDQVRISYTGDDDDERQNASFGAVAFDPTAGEDGEYVVVFEATQSSATGGASEIYAQRVEPILGLRLEPEDGFISDETQAIGVVHASHFAAVVARAGGGCLVTWEGGHSPLALGEREIFGRFVGPELELESDRLRLSDMGGTGDSGFSAAHPAVATGRPGDYLAVWRGEDDVLADGEGEIFGQLLAVGVFADGFESGDLSAWSVGR